MGLQISLDYLAYLCLHCTAVLSTLFEIVGGLVDIFDMSNTPNAKFWLAQTPDTWSFGVLSLDRPATRPCVDDCQNGQYKKIKVVLVGYNSSQPIFRLKPKFYIESTGTIIYRTWVSGGKSVETSCSLPKPPNFVFFFLKTILVYCWRYSCRV